MEKSPSMDEDKSRQYARTKRRLWILDLSLTVLFLAGLLAGGLAQTLRSWVISRFEPWPLQVAVYVSALWILMQLLLLPADYFGSFTIEHRFNLSNQKLSQWFLDYMKKLALGGTIGLGLVEGLCLLLRRTPGSWWLWATLFWMLWSAFLSWIGPTLLIPLFYRQTPLKDETLRRRLEAFVRSCETRVQGIFELNLSTTTRKANACLCGLGSTRRVLVSDTLLNAYPVEEVEVVLAHELGHHRLCHIGILIVISTLAAGLSSFLVDRAAHRWMGPLGLTGLNDLAVLPLISFGFLLTGLLFMPLTQGISRVLEKQADRFALERTGNPPAFIATMQRLAQQNLAEMDPPLWVEWILYDHPPIRKRIAMAQQLLGGTARTETAR